MRLGWLIRMLQAHLEWLSKTRKERLAIVILVFGSQRLLGMSVDTKGTRTVALEHLMGTPATYCGWKRLHHYLQNVNSLVKPLCGAVTLLSFAQYASGGAHHQPKGSEFPVHYCR